MSFPIRCFTCGKVLYEQKYKNMLEKGSKPNEALDALNYSRYCCRKIFLTHINVLDKLLPFPNDLDKQFEKKLEIK